MKVIYGLIFVIVFAAMNFERKSKWQTLKQKIKNKLKIQAQAQEHQYHQLLSDSKEQRSDATNLKDFLVHYKRFKLFKSKKIIFHLLEDLIKFQNEGLSHGNISIETIFVGDDGNPFFTQPTKVCSTENIIKDLQALGEVIFYMNGGESMIGLVNGKIYFIFNQHFDMRTQNFIGNLINGKITDLSDCMRDPWLKSYLE